MLIESVMLWLLFSLLSAVSWSTGDLFSKKNLQHLNEYTVAFTRSFFATLCLLPLLLTGIPSPDGVFWVITLVWSCMITAAFILYMRAIKLSPLSLTIPMLAFTPLFLLITSPLILGEYPTLLGLLGIVLIVGGTYFLSISDVHKSYLAPFKALAREKGAILMLIVAFIFSICTNLSKIAIQRSNPQFYGIVTSACVSGLLFLVMMTRRETSPTEIRNNLKKLFPPGLFEALRFLLALLAIESGLVPYVVAVSRTTILYSTVYGHLFFQEERLTERLAGAVTIVLGVFMISLS